jgi:hypothetical protein
MSYEEVMEVRDNYAKKDKNGNFSKAWKNSPGEMIRKTVLRRLCKNIELEFDSVERKAEWDEASEFEFDTNLEIKAPVAMPEAIPDEEVETEAPNSIPDTPTEARSEVKAPSTLPEGSKPSEKKQGKDNGLTNDQAINMIDRATSMMADGNLDVKTELISKYTMYQGKSFENAEGLRNYNEQFPKNTRMHIVLAKIKPEFIGVFGEEAYTKLRNEVVK